MDRQHARHTGLFCGMFRFLPVFADTCDSRSSSFFHFEERFLAARSPIVEEFFDLFRTDTYAHP